MPLLDGEQGFNCLLLDLFRPSLDPLDQFFQLVAHPTILSRYSRRACKASALALPRRVPFHRPPADVAAAKALRPADFFDRRIGALARGFDILAERAHVEHAPAVRKNFPALGSGAGVKDLDAFDARCRVQSLDRRT